VRREEAYRVPRASNEKGLGAVLCPRPVQFREECPYQGSGVHQELRTSTSNQKCQRATTEEFLKFLSEYGCGRDRVAVVCKHNGGAA
jgi:hypothetical protein